MRFVAVARQIIACSMLVVCTAPASLAAPHAPGIAPLKPNSSQASAPARDSDMVMNILGKKKFASVAAAAICTEDLATISFSEYSVDWSGWVKNIASRWQDAMNRPGITSGLAPSGPLFVEFTCNKDGTVSDVLIDHSCGDRTCDAISVGTLLHCLPLPAFPSDSRKKSITVLCIWSYNNRVPVARSARRHSDKQAMRISISGATL